EGIDQTHFISLKNRFLKFTFNRCNKIELIDYLKFYNNQLIDTEFYYDEDRFLHYINKLNNVNIPYRDLHHISILSRYDIESIVDKINNYSETIPPEPLGTSLDKMFSSLHHIVDVDKSNKDDNKIDETDGSNEQDRKSVV